jgi:hypothetical protein
MKESRKVFEKAGLTDPQAYMEKLFDIIRKLKSAGAGILLGTEKSFDWDHQIILIAIYYFYLNDLGLLLFLFLVCCD